MNGKIHKKVKKEDKNAMFKALKKCISDIKQHCISSETIIKLVEKEFRNGK